MEPAEEERARGYRPDDDDQTSCRRSCCACYTCSSSWRSVREEREREKEKAMLMLVQKSNSPELVSIADDFARVLLVLLVLSTEEHLC